MAIFGLTTKETEIVGDPEYIKDLIIDEEIEVAGRLVPEQKKQT